MLANTANPLAYGPSSSNTNTDASLLGFSASYGNTTSSLADGGDNLREWATYFGTPNKEMRLDPGMAYPRENRQLPEAFRGSSLYLDLIVIYLLKISQMYAITRLLPLRQWDNATVITWDMWKFDDHTLDRVPEESMSRLTTNSMSQGRDTFFRWGKAFLLEHGFAKTPRGRMNYRMNLLQLASATITTLCLGAIIALLACQGMTFIPSQGPIVIDDDNKRRALFQREIDEWGCIHKQESPIIWLWNRLSTAIRDRTGEDANILVVPAGSLANNASPLQNYYFNTGKPQDFQREQQTPAGVSVFESLGYRTGDGVVEDPLKQQRKVGQYGYALNHHLANIKDCEYQTSMMDIGMFAETANMFKRIKYHEGLVATGMFVEDPITGQWGLSQVGKVFFSGSLTWGQYMQEVEVLDKWCSQLVNGSKSRLYEFIDRFGKESKPTYPGSHNQQPVVFTGAGTPFVSADGLTLLKKIHDDYKKKPVPNSNPLPVPNPPEFNPAYSLSLEGSGSGDSKAAKDSKDDYATLASKLINKPIRNNADKWMYRYSLCVLLVTKDAQLKNWLQEYVDDVQSTFTADQIAKSAAGKYATKMGGKAEKTLRFVQPFGLPENVLTASTAAPTWTAMAAPSKDSTALSVDDLYAYFSGWSTSRSATANHMKKICKKFFEAKIDEMPERVFTGQTGIYELAWEIKEMIFAAGSKTPDELADNLMKKAADGIYARLNNMGFDEIMQYTQQTYTQPNVSGRFAQKVVQHTQELKQPLPSQGDVDSKSYIYEQLPVITKLLDGEANVFAMYNMLCRVPSVPGQHTQITEVAFTRLLVLVEGWFSKQMEQIEKAGLGDDAKNATIDAVTFFLQEVTWQRIVNVNQIVNYNDWSDMFTKSVGIQQLFEKAESTGFNRSLDTTMQQFSLVMDELDDEFTTNWHTNLPLDVQDAIKNQKRLAGILKDDVSDVVAINNILDSLRQQEGKKLDDDKKNDVVSADYIRTLLLGKRIVDGEMVRFGIKNDMWPLVGLVYVKKDGTWLMGSAFAMLGDGRCGWTFQGHHDMQIQDDATHKMHVGHWTLYAKNTVIRKDGVAHALNVKAYDYIGGNENTLWNLASETDRREYAEGNWYYRSVFSIPVKVNKNMDQMPFFDITGTFNKYLGSTPEYMQDPMFPVMADAWGWKKDPTNPLTRSIVPREETQRNTCCTIVFMASMLLYNHQTRDISMRIRGCGHWGDREYDGCGNHRRGAAQYLYPVGAPGTSITAIVY
jgi:hypothetical protein